MPGPVASGDRAVRKANTIAILELTNPEGETDAVMEAGHAPFPLGVTRAPSPGWGLLEAGGLGEGLLFFLLSPGSVHRQLHS